VDDGDRLRLENVPAMCLSAAIAVRAGPRRWTRWSSPSPRAPGAVVFPLALRPCELRACELRACGNARSEPREVVMWQPLSLSSLRAGTARSGRGWQRREPGGSRSSGHMGLRCEHRGGPVHRMRPATLSVSYRRTAKRAVGRCPTATPTTRPNHQRGDGLRRCRGTLLSPSGSPSRRSRHAEGVCHLSARRPACPYEDWH
jgi:hypothetical protein